MHSEGRMFFQATSIFLAYVGCDEKHGTKHRILSCSIHLFEVQEQFWNWTMFYFPSKAVTCLKRADRNLSSILAQNQDKSQPSPFFPISLQKASQETELGGHILPQWHFSSLDPKHHWTWTPWLFKTFNSTRLLSTENQLILFMTRGF